MQALIGLARETVPSGYHPPVEEALRWRPEIRICGETSP
jgi:hypothetical protein